MWNKRWQLCFSTDSKIIGIQYGITSMSFLLLGFMLMLLMRWQLAFPGHPLPLLGKLFSDSLMPGGIMIPDFYNMLGAMHGTIMIFLGVVPMGVGAFGNYLVPLMVGSPVAAFPRLNRFGFWLYFLGGLVWLFSFLLPGGAASAGWTSYPPLSILASPGQTWWLVGLLCIAISSQIGAINLLTTALQSALPGMSFSRWPITVWAQSVAAFLLLLAFPPLEIAALLQLMDRLSGSSFFLPSGLIISGTPLTVAGGGNPLLWQHLFWFLAHPEVYVLILPAIGIVAEILVSGTRKPLYGYPTIVRSLLFLGALSFLVWAHHMFLTDMGVKLSGFFQATTMIVSIPSVIVLTSFLLTLWGASIRFTVPMLFALAFLPMFGLGGLTGIPLGLAASDIPLHDTYYVIGHFHYIVAPGTLFALMGGLYYWYPRITGRMMNEAWGKIHFWLSFTSINFVFFPMLLLGLAGVSRRLYDQTIYAHGRAVQPLNLVISMAAWTLAVAQLPFLFNLLTSWKWGKPAPSKNPWGSPTLDWAEMLPPRIVRGAYEEENLNEVTTPRN